MRFLLTLFLLASLIGFVPAPGTAQITDGMDETNAAELERWDAEAGLVEQLIAGGSLSAAEIEGMRATLEDQRSAVPGLTASIEEELAPLRLQLDALGAAPDEPDGEAEQLADERKRLQMRIAAVEIGLKRAGRADARAAALLSDLSRIRREQFTRQLLTRAPSIFEPGAIGRAIASIERVARIIGSETSARIVESTMDTPFFVRVLSPLILIGIAVFILLKLKRAALRRLLRAATPDSPRKRTAITGFSITMVRLILPALALALVSFAIWNSRLLGPQGEILLSGMARALMAVIVAYALGGAFYAPRLPEFRLSKLGDADAVAALRWLMALSGVVGLDLLFVVQGQRLGLSLEGLEFLNSILLVFGGIALWGYANYLVPAATEPIAPVPDGDEDADSASVTDREPSHSPLLIAFARVIIRIAAVIAPALALMGYFAASQFVFYPVVFSGAVIGICVLLFRRVRDVIDRVVAPEGSEASARSRIRLIPVAVAFLLICLAVPVLATIWGADTTDMSGAWRSVSEGFVVGDVVISPIDFFAFLLVFSVGYVLTRILQGVLSRSVLPVTGLDAGGKAAICAGVGYVGIILSALIAISATGLDLSNLAIVAGALSVGIGFGLQNIVNNFVSGLILLIERPIKEGDWVELTSGMGYVKRVNVRSTEIETFDRASLFVPNSELISGTVTNWTHSNLNGRLIVPVGVAYGTDPRRIETILTEIAKAHPMLLRHPAPYVLFRRFGADALEFEIRGVLRDVNWILNVTSDINFEISRCFEEEDIEIPFAQRDLHIRNADELGQSIRTALHGKDEPEPEPQPGPAPVPLPPRQPERRDGAGYDDPGGET